MEEEKGTLINVNMPRRDYQVVASLYGTVKMWTGCTEPVLESVENEERYIFEFQVGGKTWSAEVPFKSIDYIEWG